MSSSNYMEIEGFDLNKVYANAGNHSKRADDLIDRSKVKILLCDNDTKSSEEVLTLLSGCSYQVTSVSSPRQVIDVLNAEAQDIDVILAEVDLPMKKGMKMLKYIARNKDLHRIPVIMTSAHHEVSIVMKCLRLGAADYLIKPLRSNELLNLWTHMWRRRRMLGLTEKNIMNYNFDLVASAIMNYDSDLVASDPGDGNTTSTALFSDDTEDKSNRSTNPEAGMLIQRQDESKGAAADAPEKPPAGHASDYLLGVPGISDHQTRHCSSGPKKSGLRIGESSAFFSYVKTTMQKSNLEGIPQAQSNAATQLRMEDMHQTCPRGVYDLKTHENRVPSERPNKDYLPSSISNADSFSVDNSSAPPASMGALNQKNLNEHLPQDVICIRNGSHIPETEVPGTPSHHAHPHYISGFFNHLLMLSSAPMYPKNHQDQQNHASWITSLPYYPMTICLQPGQTSSAHSRPSFGSSGSSKAKVDVVDRRAEALMKFRKKRKERCFDKKIRYVNRKQLAERRPRVRGQFAKKLNGVTVDLNGQPASIDYDEEEEEDDDEENNVRDSSPEDARECRISALSEDP
ncbi:two-component response regulator-like APRR1 [Neltuma alba]|uniref:two-component response regulator-like APRR1 n=1 Tax=Neltuma alba TaxID=207710 RepID=UPI0010A4BCDD|nr:two-component response regulator-like APRR1 [Prosopis alba]